MGGSDRYPEEHAFHRGGTKILPITATSQGYGYPFTKSLNAPEGPSSLVPLPFRLLTHNIRYAARDLFPHERPWPQRLPNLLRQFHHYTASPFNPLSTVICLQEVLQSQLSDLATAFGDEWAHVGVGRDDGKAAGEFNPVFYNTQGWAQAHSETIWLSDTPERPSRGWDAGSNRLCTCVVLQSRLTGSHARKVMVLNTHLDNASKLARRNGALLILKYAKRWRKDFDVDHVFLSGDLNSTRDERHGAWEVLNTSDSGFVDVGRFLRTDDVRQFGDEITFTGFDGHGDEDAARTLDFVHHGLSEEETIGEASHRLRSYSVVPNLFDDGIRCSDHRAVVVDLVL